MTKRSNDTYQNKIQLHFYSAKNKRLCKPDSNLEKAILTVFEFDDNIKRYQPQPFSTLYENEEGTVCRYTQDILTEHQDGSVHNIEVKKEYFAKKLEFRSKFPILNRHYKKRYNATLELYTDKKYSKARFKNCKDLYRFRIKPLSQEENELASHYRANSLLFGELKKFVVSEGHSISVAFRLVAHRAFEWNMDDFLTESTCLELR